MFRDWIIGGIQVVFELNELLEFHQANTMKGESCREIESVYKGEVTVTVNSFLKHINLDFTCILSWCNGKYKLFYFK